MEEKKEQNEKTGMSDSRRRNFSYTIWILAGGYLLYLVWSMMRSGEETTALVFIFMGVFTLVGIFLIVQGLLGMKRLKKEKKEMEE